MTEGESEELADAVKDSRRSEDVVIRQELAHVPDIDRIECRDRDAPSFKNRGRDRNDDERHCEPRDTRHEAPEKKENHERGPAET